MTLAELMKVRVLYEELTECERTLKVLKKYDGIESPKVDGMPKGKKIASRVEIITLRIVETEKRIESLKAEIVRAGEELQRAIIREVDDKAGRTILILRYVDCMRFCDIAPALEYSEAHTYYLHRVTLEKIIEDNRK